MKKIFRFLIQLIAVIPLIIGFIGILLIELSNKLSDNEDDSDIYTHGPYKGMPKL